MIGKLRGIVDSYGEDWVILDVGGVGYLVSCSTRTLTALPPAGEAAALSIETYVREDQIRAVVSSIDRPLNVIMGLDGVGITLAQLQQAGVKRVSVGSSFARAALGAFQRAALEVRDQGTFQYARQAMPYGEANKAFGG